MNTRARAKHVVTSLLLLFFFSVFYFSTDLGVVFEELGRDKKENVKVKRGSYQ